MTIELPEPECPWVPRKLRAAWGNPSAGEAEASLRALAAQLDKVNPDAAASPRERLVETLTVTRLGVTGALLKTVMGTNPTESMIEIVRAPSRNVSDGSRGACVCPDFEGVGPVSGPCRHRSTP